MASCTNRLYDQGRVVDYIHYSLVMHKHRRMPVYAAYNTDRAQWRLVPAPGQAWELDPRVERTAQTGQGAYHNNPLDRVGLVPPSAVAWGAEQEARDAVDAVCYFTNAVPQHEQFRNEWTELEDWVLDKAGNGPDRLCVFTGPVFTRKDDFFNDVRMPSAFWKVIVLRDPMVGGEDLAVLGFVMKQHADLESWNGAGVENLTVYQVGIREIMAYTGLRFGDLAILDEFEWRQANFRDRTRMQPVAIKSPDDIAFFGDRRRARGLHVRRVGPGEEKKPTRSGEPSPCGCGDINDEADDRYAALANQVQALRDVIDTLLEEKKQAGEPETRSFQLARDHFSRIVGGEQVSLDEFPECACIGDLHNGRYRWFCSGVLIAPRVVLTAAHCAPAIDQVYLGGRSLNLVGTDGDVIPVERVLIHPDYDPRQIPSHDIAVLLLERDAAIMPVPLAPREAVDAENHVRLVGFGFDHPTLEVGFGTKRKVDVPLTNLQGFSDDQAFQVEITHGFDNRFELHAGRKELGKDSCNGDSGGPAYIVDQEGVFRLAGLTSRAAFSSELPCGDGGIYTRVTPYLDWLRAVTGEALETDGEQNGSDDGSPTSDSGSLYISAAMPNPAGPDAGNEWVELTNPSDTDINLVGYQLEDKQAGVHTLSEVLSAGVTLRVVLPSNSPVKLSNKGDDIVLKNNAAVVHQVSYTSAGSGEIIRFDPPVEDPEEDTGGPVDDGCGNAASVRGIPDADPC